MRACRILSTANFNSLDEASSIQTNRTLRATALLDTHENNKLESSMAKVKAGKAVTWVTQKAVELLGPRGYSTETLAEKWMRDAKINDIYEGTGQINTLIVAREILGYTRTELK